MAPNIAHRRAAKAARRKKLLASRRAAEPVSLADRVRRLATGQLYWCLMQQEAGINSVFLAREAQTGEIALAAFLVDAFALGIKDVFFNVMQPTDFKEFLGIAQHAAPVTPVEPSYARKLVREAAAYAATLGLRPPRQFASIEPFFGDVRAEDCVETFVFGRDGKPFYVVGPTETARQVATRLQHLAEQLGPEGFDFVIPEEDENDTDAA
jgi:hypothetical protein